MEKVFLKCKKHYKYLFIIFFVIFLISINYIYGKNIDEIKPIENELANEKVELKTEEPLPNDFVVFDIKGAVQKPGAYKLNSDKRIYDAIRVSGGLTKDADTTLINLSKKIKDEMVIIIHTKEQVDGYTKKEPTIIYKDAECVCPEIKNDGCAFEGNNNMGNTQKDKISINHASLEELIKIPGIGEAKAKSIIEYRNLNNGFNNIEELLNIKGIGETVFAKLKDFITI